MKTVRLREVRLLTQGHTAPIRLYQEVSVPSQFWVTDPRRLAPGSLVGIMGEAGFRSLFMSWLVLDSWFPHLSTGSNLRSFSLGTSRPLV